jgi:hypothetical protein
VAEGEWRIGGEKDILHNMLAPVGAQLRSARAHDGVAGRDVGLLAPTPCVNMQASEA